MSNTDIIAILPLLILAGGGFVVLLWDALVRSSSSSSQTLTSLFAIGAIVTAVSNLMQTPVVAFDGSFFSNSYTNFFTIIFSSGVLLTSLLAQSYMQGHESIKGEFSALLLFSASGMVMLASGANLIVSFLGLETMSIAFYVMAGLFRKQEGSNESALKYFLLGAFATGFFVYGIALIYGCTGTMSLQAIHAMMSASNSPSLATYDSNLFLLGMVLIAVGLLFKVAAFPFHAWAPDVYEGAPTIVSGFMSTAGKGAAFAAFVSLFMYALIPGTHPHAGAGKIQIVLAVVAAASMLYGNIVAISQTKIKRMLAYSSIAHAGYLLLGVSSFDPEGITGIAIYSAVYLLMQTAAFGVVAVLEHENGAGLDIKDYAGLASKRPWLSLLMALLMFSLAGIPPFAGFFGKYYLFLAAIHSGMTWLAIVGVVSSIIASYFYLRIIVMMYFRDSKSSAQVQSEGRSISIYAIGLAVVALIVFGLAPSLLLGVASHY